MTNFIKTILVWLGYLILVLLFIAAASLIIDFIMWIWDIDVRLWR